MRDGATGMPKGFAFIGFGSFAASDAAIQYMNNQLMCNKVLKVQYARRKGTDERHGSQAERLLAAEAEKLGKPYPGVYLTAASKLGVPPSSCLALEDSLNGTLAAKSAKMKCISVPEDYENRSLAFHIANVQLRSLEDMNETIWNGIWRT